MPIKYEQWPPRQSLGGQHVGTGPNGVRGVHFTEAHGPTGLEAFCELHRSPHKNRLAVQEMIEWALASANMSDTL